MTERNPYAALRPYYKGHNRAEDEKLAKELFFGTIVRDKKRRRDCHYYLPKHSQEERLAFEALERLLVDSCGDLDPEVLGGLVSSLGRGGSFGRRLIFEKKRKRRADSVTYLQIAMHVRDLRKAGWQKDAAVKDAEDKYNVSRKTAYKALKRVRRDSPWLEV
jgi:hypothetical protein